MSFLSAIESGGITSISLAGARESGNGQVATGTPMRCVMAPPAPARMWLPEIANDVFEEFCMLIEVEETRDLASLQFA